MHVHIHYTYADTRNIIRMHLYTQATDGKTRSYRQKPRAYSTGIKDASRQPQVCEYFLHVWFMVYIAQTKSFFYKSLPWHTAMFLDRPMCPALKIYTLQIATRTQTPTLA